MPVLFDLLILLAVLLISVWQLTLLRCMMKWDIIDLNLPFRYYISECLRNGYLPLWNPYITTGFPQTADPMTWYPLSWITGLIFGNSLLTLQYEYVFHLFLAGTGYYLLGSHWQFDRKTRLIIAISFMLSGLFIGNAQHLGWVISGAWFPFVVGFYMRFYREQTLQTGLLFVISLFCMLTGGYPAFFIVTVYILGIVFMIGFINKIRSQDHAGKFLLNNLIVALVFLLLSAVVLVSSFELYEHLYRIRRFSPEFVQSFPLPLQGLISFLFPYATTGNTDFFGTDFSMVNCYAGFMILIFSVYACMVRKRMACLFVLFGLIFLSIALADVFPFRRILYYLPFMNIFRFPALFRFFAYAFFIIAGGLGIQHYLKHQEKDYKMQPIIIAFIIIGLLFLIYSGLHIEKWKFKLLLHFHFNQFDQIATFFERIFLQTGILVGLLTIMLILFYRLPHTTFVKALVWITAVDMFLAVQFNIFHTVIFNQNPHVPQMAIKNLPKGFPVPEMQQDVSENTEVSVTPIPGLWRNMNIFYKKLTSAGYTPYSLNSMVMAENTGNYMPLLHNPPAFLTNRFSDKGLVDSISIDSLSSHKIRISRFSPNAVEMEIRTDKRQLLVYLMNFYPGWKVALNDQPSQKPLIANYTFMAVWVNKGINKVTFEYKPLSVLTAFYISLATGLLILIFLITTVLFPTLLRPLYPLRKFQV